MNEMTKSMKRNKFAFRIVFFTLAALLLVLSTLASVPRWREQIRSYFIRPYRQVLAKVEGDLTGKGDIVSVVKLKTETGILVEVYEHLPAGGERLRARLQLEERRDAHIDIRGQVTNLALADLDGDHILEILSPVYDENLVPRLHVFKYDPVEKSFVRMGADAVNP
ncbi:MAG: hypothetical protein C5B49_06610 [Bdellovibrio sp.]|nr:MAG: hypothetical protein C5B49_06610 [Bdellovibrio sp.]